MAEFRCDHCGSAKSTKVVGVTAAGAYRLRRRRVCRCGHRFSTMEITIEEYGLLDTLSGSDIAKLLKASRQVTTTVEAFIRQRQGA